MSIFACQIQCVRNFNSYQMNLLILQNRHEFKKITIKKKLGLKNEGNVRKFEFFFDSFNSFTVIVTSLLKKVF